MRNYFLRSVVCLACAWASLDASAGRAAEDRFLAKGGRAEATIVVGQKAPAFDRWVAGELQRYVKQLSGADLPLVTHDKLPPTGRLLIVVGGPQTNPLAAAAQEKRLVAIASLKPEGFILKNIDIEGQPAIVVAGNDEAGTMYAAYELLERLGIVFQSTNDIIPQQRPDLALPALDLRIEPVLKYRGTQFGHGVQWYMGLEDFRKHIDQMAKLKMNCLMFACCVGSPWLEFSYGGKVAEIIYDKKTGYVARSFGHSTGGTAKDVRVGRECFPRDYLGPPEFAHVRTQQEAYHAAREFLRELIRYAHQRKIQVWLMLAHIPYVPPNLVPPGQATSHDMFCGKALPSGSPVLEDIWDVMFGSLIETYPEADAYSVLTGEAYLSTNDPAIKQLLRECESARKLVLPPAEIRRLGHRGARSEESIDSDLVQVAVAKKVLERVKVRHPDAKLGLGLLFRPYLLRAVDSMLPKDVWLINMENWAGTKSVMHFYDGIKGREMIVWPRYVDDGAELHMQMNAMMFDRDEIITGAVRYGAAGMVGMLPKERGQECIVRYVAEGTWNPEIECQSFYEGYLGRLYGPKALNVLLKAYLMLEEGDKALGWHGRSDIFRGWTRFTPVHGPPYNPNVFGETRPDIPPEKLEKEISAAVEKQQRWAGMAIHYRKALDLLREARPRVLPGARAELDYVIFKTESFASYLEVLAAGNEWVAALERVLLAKTRGETEKVSKYLDEAHAAIDRADRLAQEVARQMIPFAGIPTEKYQLFRFNQNVIAWTEKACAAMAKIIALHEEPAR